MRQVLPAFAVHLFTATGAVLAFQALLAATAHNWEASFAWLGAALAVDAVDGPIARAIHITKRLPRFSGERLDLIIDYLTYVMVPAYIVYEAQLMPPQLNSVAASLILLSSLYHFADCESKTDDGFFVGFPALWNLVVLYFFVFPTPQWLTFAVVAVLTLLTFFPGKWVHPVRARRLRWLTAIVVTAWAVAAISILATGFPGSLAAQIALALSGVYFAGVGVIRSLGR